MGAGEVSDLYPGETRLHLRAAQIADTRRQAVATKLPPAAWILWFESLADAKIPAPQMGAGLLAPPARLELTTLRLGGVRSIQVSYGDINGTVAL